MLTMTIPCIAGVDKPVLRLLPVRAAGARDRTRGWSERLVR
jgi:hypothetical protein